MKKKRGDKFKTKLGIKHHIKHKSKLTLLLVLKLILAAFVLMAVVKFTYFKLYIPLGETFAFLISFAIACLIYLFLVTKVLDVMKFD